MIPTLHGITEIVGESGVGKSILALSLEGHLKTLYVTLQSRNIIKERENATIYRIPSFMRLKAFFSRDLRGIVKEHCFEKIVLDGLEDYLYVFEKPRMHTEEVFRILRILKYLCIVKGVSIVIVNSSYGKFNIEGTRIANSYFGLPWEYMIDRRYLVSREEGKRRIRLVTGDIEKEWEFIIIESKAEFITV
ncbi:hypothetical protein GINT2_001569 [Glugoides intestinalis]